MQKSRGQMLRPTSDVPSIQLGWVGGKNWQIEFDRIVQQLETE